MIGFEIWSPQDFLQEGFRDFPIINIGFRNKPYGNGFYIIILGYGFGINWY